ncbi:MAG: hypothetical protein ACR2PA_19065 [Hyphomicrobiaceae bacterium]
MTVFRYTVAVLFVASMFVARNAGAQGNPDCGAWDSLTNANQMTCLDIQIENKKRAIHARIEKIVSGRSKLESNNIRLGEDWGQALSDEAEALFKFSKATCTVAWFEGGATNAGGFELRFCQLKRLNRYIKQLDGYRIE